MKKNLRKRSISWLLTLAMVLTMLPAAALAAEPETLPTTPPVETLPQKETLGTDLPEQNDDLPPEDGNVPTEDEATPLENGPVVPAATEITGSIGSAEGANLAWNEGDTIATGGVTITGGDDAETPVTITVNGTVTVKGIITVDGGYVKFLGGGTLKRGTGFEDRMFDFKAKTSDASDPVPSNTTITNVTLDGGAVWQSDTGTDGAAEAEAFLNRGTQNTGLSGLGFSVAGASTLTLGQGAVVKNFCGNSGIFTVATGSTLNVAGAAFQDNQYMGDGANAGMFMMLGGTMEMTAGTVSGNYITNPDKNCGVFTAAGTGTIAISGGKLEKNLSAGSGGALATAALLDNAGSITLSGDAQVTGNKAAKNGGGVYISAGKFTMEGNAQVTGNTALKGGGIYVADGEVKLNAGTIQENRSTLDMANQYAGGGVAVMGGTVTIGDKTGNADMLIQKNHAYDGGGVMVRAAGATVTINSDAKISRNTSTFGAGVYASNGKLTIDGATITENLGQGIPTQSVASGAGLMVENANPRVTLRGNVTITGNKQGTNIDKLNEYPEDNVQLNAPQSKLSLEETLGADASVGLHTAKLTDHNDQPLVTATSPEIAANSLDRFFDDAGTYEIVQSQETTTNLVWGDKLPTMADVYVADPAHTPVGGKDENPGTIDKPVATIGKAYELVKDGGTIHVMSDLTIDTGVAVNKAKTVTILSDSNGSLDDKKSFTLTRAEGFLGTFFGVTKGSLTVTNLVLDGGAVWNEYGPSGTENGHKNGDNNTASNTAATQPLIHITGSGDVTLGQGAILQNNQNTSTFEPNGGGAVMVSGGSLTIQDNATIRNNYYHRFGSAVYAGYGKASDLTIKDQALITGNVSGADGAAITAKSCDLTMSGGTITGNKALGGYVTGKPFDSLDPKRGELRNNGSGGISFPERSGSITMSGLVKVYDNYQYQQGNSILRNVLLNNAKTITVGTEGLDEDSRIGFYTLDATKLATKDVKFATNAKVEHLANFISDNAAFAGILWCNGSNTPENPHADTPITTDKHTPEADTLWLSVDARETADIRVSVETDGTLILEAHELNPNKFYTVLDKDGNAVNPDGLKLVDGTAASNGWSKPNANGDLVFSGLDPEQGPYQVVSSDNTDNAPTGTATAPGNGAKVGGQIVALYVAGNAGSLTGENGETALSWAAGVNDNEANVESSGFNRGSSKFPYLTLNYAYGVLDTNYAQAGIIIVLSDIEQPGNLIVKPTTGAVILGKGEPNPIVTRAEAFKTGHMFTASGDLALYNITLDGNKTHGTQGALIYINSAHGDVLLSEDVVLRNNNGGNISDTNTAGAVAIRSGGKLTMEGTAQIKNCQVNHYGSAVVIGHNGGSGTFLMKDAASITGCKITAVSPGAGYGGAVYVWQGNFTMEGSASITGNTTADGTTPSGVYAYLASGTITLKDQAQITGNSNTSGAANLYLSSSKTVNASGLKDGAVIGVTAGAVPTKGNDTPATNDQAAMKYFFSDHPELYGVKLGTDGKVYLAVDAKMTVTAGETADDGKVSIVISPADPGKDYWAVAQDGTKVGPGVYDKNTGAVTISPLDPETEYSVVAVPKGTGPDDVSATGVGAAAIVSPPADAVVPPDDNGGYQDGTGDANETQRKENSDATKDTISIKTETGYSYALVDQDGKYYSASGNPQTTPLWQTGEDGTEKTFTVPFDKTYTVLKVPTDHKDTPNAIPALTEIPVLPPVIAADKAVNTGVESDGDAYITIDPAKADKYEYILADKEGNVLAVYDKDTGPVSFPGLLPGQEYYVKTQEKTADPKVAVGDKLSDEALKRATKVETPLPTDVTFTVSEEAGKVDATFKPATKDADYYVKTDGGDAIKGTVNDDGTVTFPGLDPNKTYTMAAVEKDTSAPGDFSKVPNHAFKTPSNGAQNAADALKGKTVETTANTITVKGVGTIPTDTEYLAVGPDGREHKGAIKDGNLVFEGLNANTKYDILVRDTDNNIDLNTGISATTKPSSSGSGSSSGGSGGGSTTSKVEKPENGSIKVDKPSAGKGQTVIITVTPDPGFELDTLVVKDKNGNELELKDLGNGKYSYVVPEARPVTITATFKQTAATGDPNTNGVADLLIVEDHIAYMQGDGAGNFRPAGNITRAETAQMFYNLLKDKNVTGNKTFADVSATAWYATAVNALANLGIVEGVGEDGYEPERAISRAEFVAVAMRFATHVTGEKTFSDVSNDYWARGYITGAAYYGWINGYEDDTFKPTNPITRAEAATVVNNMLGREGDRSYIDKADDLKFFPDVAGDYWAYYEIVEATNAHDFARDENGVENWKK